MILIQAHTYDDLYVISKMITNSEYFRFGTLSKHTTQQILIKSICEQVERGNAIYYVGSYNNKPVVVFALTKISWFNKTAELHIVTILKNDNHKFFYLASKALLKMVFDDLGLKKLYGQTPQWNSGLVDTVLLLGGRIVGVYERGQFCDGLYSSTVVLELLKNSTKFGK